MNAYVIDHFAEDPGQALRVIEKNALPPGPGEVRVRMRYASLNFRDLRIFRGQYRPALPLPVVPLSDGCGIVEATGEHVRHFHPGDRVATTFFQEVSSGGSPDSSSRVTLGCERDGVLSEWVTVPQSGLVPVPAHLSDSEASTLTCAGLTAWNALMEGDPVRPGETVLIQGTGGVSIFALQFARLSGCRTIVLSRHEEKLERARKLGASETINTRACPEWEKEVLKRTGGQGVDRVIEVTGGESLPRSLEATRTGGQIQVIGVLSGVESRVSLLPVLMKEIRLRGLLVGDRPMFLRMNRAVEANRLIPVVDRIFSFEDALDAYRVLDRGAAFGKLVIRISDS
ncbi:zinc-dependent alcohol dehydrogenase family protein [Leptospirillum ferriphilum]|uniref:Alcohol dehydrogenase n=1 Tax=Leptospirillum ferriphilum (strain ML-04) TaxID=1048260 RepID=J9Z729_LEPFM|nr:NAD(P)-dependent alcohol dehydrogenase [Leptospirillum ferriphilum]AFS52290.1 alcohol dehydrogenase [Leptospirillum ferriphilum ML-04]